MVCHNYTKLNSGGFGCIIMKLKMLTYILALNRSPSSVGVIIHYYFINNDAECSTASMQLNIVST